MPKLKHKLPSYCRHKGTGQALVRIEGRDRYLGPYGSPRSKARYEAEIARWLATKSSPVLQECAEQVPKDDLRITELLVAYLEFARQYYRKNGRPTGEIDNIRDAIRPLSELYRDGPIGDFTPACLKAVMHAMVNAGLSRKVVNARVNRLRRVFRWGVENELVEPHVLHALQAVAPLKKGCTTAPETEEVKPVPDANIEKVLPLVTAQVRAMIELQRLTGMRPGELVIMRPCDVDRSKPIWLYHPMSHKTEHHGITREVFIGPQAQQILQPFLVRDAESFLFSPREAMLEHKRQRRLSAKDAKIRAAAHVKLRVSERVGERYTRNSYHNAVYKACRKAGIRPWGPNRLRHNAATLLREQFGIEAARVILGHTSAAMTEIYAEMDRAKAADIMWQVG